MESKVEITSYLSATESHKIEKIIVRTADYKCKDWILSIVLKHGAGTVSFELINVCEISLHQWNDFLHDSGYSSRRFDAARDNIIMEKEHDMIEFYQWTEQDAGRTPIISIKTPLQPFKHALKNALYDALSKGYYIKPSELQIK